MAAEFAQPEKDGKPRRGGPRRPVVCLETGEVYRDSAAAAAAHGIKHPTLVNRCARGGLLTTGGLHWAFVSEGKTGDDIEAIEHARKASPHRAVRCVETGEVFGDCSKAAASVGLGSASSIYACLRGRAKTAGGLHWDYADGKGAAAFLGSSTDPADVLRDGRSKGRRVVCLETGVVYESLASAARANPPATAAGISCCLNGSAASAGGLHWASPESGLSAADILSMELPKKRRTAPVRCVETGEVFPTAEAAAEAVGCKSSSNICACVKGRTLTAAGLHWAPVWSDVTVEGIEGSRERPVRPVVCLETGKVYRSAKAAAEAVGLKGSSGVWYCAQGRSKTAGGFHWAYADEAPREGSRS